LYKHGAVHKTVETLEREFKEKQIQEILSQYPDLSDEELDLLTKKPVSRYALGGFMFSPETKLSTKTGHISTLWGAIKLMKKIKPPVNDNPLRLKDYTKLKKHLKGKIAKAYEVKPAKIRDLVRKLGVESE
jgi:hypothetical protein